MNIEQYLLCRRILECLKKILIADFSVVVFVLPLTEIQMARRVFVWIVERDFSTWVVDDRVLYGNSMGDE
jgi:hypothetical protein